MRDGRGNLKSVEAAATTLEGEKVDLIVAITTSVTLAAKRATTSVPIVFYDGTDPVSTGLVESFRKPQDCENPRPHDSQIGAGPSG